ncbi:MAG: thioredoxin domain-containing protein, partial [Deltaproteobacteria bacterium]
MASTHANKYCNHLINEKSPYLLQHAHNPVNWYPWGEEAFQKAKKENKPIFLSVGYATCHWCHVMEKESFEDEEVAELLNRYFVSIKVDREERPDVDQVYMNVCQAMTGSGGWPLSVFMTPDGKPFFAGTYFPKEGRRGMPGFKDVVIQIGELWKKDREKLFAASENIISALEKRVRPDESAEKIGLDVLKKAFDHMSIAFDPKWGGFSFPPKFPTPHNYTFLLRWYNRTEEAKVLEMVEKSLTEMRNGGIFDQIGFGFHRYSVDERWLVPHFEKMLYDQALISIAYLDAYLVTKKDRYLQVAEEIFTYVLRDMTSPEGGFYTAEDADSEGREGKFYVWTPKEVKSILGNVRGELFCQFYNISEKGNFEGGYSIPHISKPLKDIAEERKISIDELAKELERGRRKLFEVREKRVHPLKDDKILTSWNGLMIAALAR